MRAVVCTGFGLDHAAVQDCAEPALGDDGVRIRVAAAGVSFANRLVIEGKHQNRWEPPFTPGTDVAGDVIACGRLVSRFRPGDHVLAAIKTGGFAQQVVAPEHTVFAGPAAVDPVAAVHFPTIVGTAYAALVWRARLQAGETLLVHGAAGGSGLAAIGVGKRLGANIIATAGGPAKVEAARAQGADLALDTRAGGFRDAVLQATQGRGADVVFDPVGGAVFDESLRCIAPGGRIIPMGFASGVMPQVAANLALVKNIDVIGLYWGYYLGWGRQMPPPGTQQAVREAFGQMLDWAAQGTLKTRTHATYALDGFREALAALASREVIGRVALLPQA